MTLTEAIASVGPGRLWSHQLIFRTRRKNLKTGKIESHYRTDAPFRGKYVVVAFVKRDGDGRPDFAQMADASTKAERAEIEAFRFEEAAK